MTATGPGADAGRTSNQTLTGLTTPSSATGAAGATAARRGKGGGRGSGRDSSAASSLQRMARRCGFSEFCHRTCLSYIGSRPVECC